VTDFERALARYREAVEAAARAAVTDEDRRMCGIYLAGIRLIECRYAETREAVHCRTLLEDEQTLHEVDNLRGDGVGKMRETLNHLVRLVST